MAHRFSARFLLAISQMPITLSMHRRWGFHVLRFEGKIVFEELVELGRLHASMPAFASADALHIVDELADLSAVRLDHLDALREHYSQLQRVLDLYLVRRSAWVCGSAAACSVVEYWLSGRHSRDGQQTEVVLASDLAGTMPLFSREEIDAVELGVEFTKLMTIGQAKRANDHAA